MDYEIVNGVEKHLMFVDNSFEFFQETINEMFHKIEDNIIKTKDNINNTIDKLKISKPNYIESLKEKELEEKLDKKQKDILNKNPTTSLDFIEECTKAVEQEFNPVIKFEFNTTKPMQNLLEKVKVDIRQMKSTHIKQKIKEEQDENWNNNKNDDEIIKKLDIDQSKFNIRTKRILPQYIKTLTHLEFNSDSMLLVTRSSHTFKHNDTIKYNQLFKIKNMIKTITHNLPRKYDNIRRNFLVLRYYKFQNLIEPELITRVMLQFKTKYKTELDGFTIDM